MTRKATILDKTLREKEKVTVGCAFCRWRLRGLSADEGVEAAREHRRRHHPELPEVSPRRHHRMVPR